MDRNPAGALDGGPASSLAVRLQGVQHFGLTVQNMDRAYEFYTEVLGGTEVLRDGDFQGKDVHNTIMADQEILAAEYGTSPASIGVADLAGGHQRLDVRFVHFGNVAIELLQYRDATENQGDGRSFLSPREYMSPAYPRSMHICFEVRSDVDIDTFIADLEAESARRGMSQVRANRTETVRSEEARRAAPLDANTNKIRNGPSDGWSFIYCKGPEGEQLEFVQVIDPVRQTFEDGRRRHLAQQPDQ